ncbi:MAG: hypothetical protein D6696_13050, partial [Acidobacteria bacterium]
LLPLAACGGSPAPPPVVLIGVDGLEWQVLEPLLAAGELPALADLAARGSAGLLSTLEPTLSPAIWTTIATGKPPQEHGIVNFAALEGERLRLLTNRDRRTKALWNVATDAGRSSCVIGWWMTFPAERIDGVMVAQTNTLRQLAVAYGRAIWKGRLVRGLPGQVYPPQRQDEIMAVAAAVESDLDRRMEDVFGVFPHPLRELERRLWDNTRWTFRADAIYAAIARRLLDQGTECELLMVYFGGPDVVGHRFWRYYRPELFAHRPSAEELANFARVIPDYYRYVDRLIGDLVSRLDPRARVIVVSDHGMHAVNVDQRFDRDRPPADVNSGNHQDAPPGVIFAAGADLAQRPLPAAGRPPVAGSVLDLTPTVLALLELPIGRDMKGEILRTLLAPGFLQRHPPAYVATHDSRRWLAERPQQLLDPAVEQERLEQLRALGYL